MCNIYTVYMSTYWLDTYIKIICCVFAYIKMKSWVRFLYGLVCVFSVCFLCVVWLPFTVQRHVTRLKTNRTVSVSPI